MLSWSPFFGKNEWPSDRWVVGIPSADPKAEKLATELRKLAVQASKLAYLVGACDHAKPPRQSAGPPACP